MKEYNLKFTQLSCYSLDEVTNMRNGMNIFVLEFSILLIKEGKVTILVGDMDIDGLMIYVQ